MLRVAWSPRTPPASEVSKSSQKVHVYKVLPLCRRGAAFYVATPRSAALWRRSRRRERGVAGVQNKNRVRSEGTSDGMLRQQHVVRHSAPVVEANRHAPQNALKVVPYATSSHHNQKRVRGVA